MRNKLFLAATLLLALGLAFSAYKTQTDLKTARVVFFATAPADPRALMMGDYMTLSYAFEPSLWDRQKLCNRQGCAVLPDVTLYIGPDGVVRKEGPGEPLVIKGGPGRYRIPAQFFFTEGTGARYEGAPYAAMKVLPNGKLSVVGLADQNLQLIK